MNLLIGILFGVFSSTVQAQSDLGISPSDLMEAEAAQQREDRREHLLWNLFESLNDVKAVEIAIPGPTLPDSIVLDDGKFKADGSNYSGGSTSCKVKIKNKTRIPRNTMRVRVRVDLDSLEEYNLEKQTIASAVWAGKVQACDASRVCVDIANARMVCSLGWWNPLGSQPKSISAGVVKYNLGSHARYH